MKYLFKSIIALVVFIASTAGSRAQLPAVSTVHFAAQPNVLIILTDDQRADTIAALGNPIIQTPNMDRLVHRGVSFNRAYMMGGLKGATCVPSRAMQLSGRSLFRVDEKLTDHET